MSPQSFLKPGQTLDNRYTILRQIGHGGFGRTYLATDSRRHQERCVLKEFAPLITARPDDMAKARDLFQREAAVLHHLDHPQIPEFREEFEIYDGTQSRWIVVQEWIEGETYLSLLRSGPFLEVQVVQFLRDFLPILDYLHHHNPLVIHRDIALDNILFNTANNRPTLIDFGTVRQAVSQISGMAEARTYVAKQGYSAPELSLGEAYPSSDLYSLGVCAIALLTGQPNPGIFYDPRSDRWHWRPYAAVSSGLAALLDRLVAPQPFSRYGSAAEVLDQLNRLQAAALPPTQVLSAPPATPYPTRIQAQGTQIQPAQIQPAQSHPAQPVYAQTIPPFQVQGLPQELPLATGHFPSEYPTTARTVAVGRAPRTEVHGRALTHPSQTSAAINPSEPTQYIWPLWARPLLFVQPLLSLLAYRVGPALLTLLLVYGGIRRAVPWMWNQTQLAQRSPTRNPFPPVQPTFEADSSKEQSEQNPERGAAQPTAQSPDAQSPQAPSSKTQSSDAKSPEGQSPEGQSPEIQTPVIETVANREPPAIEFPNISLPTVELPTVTLPQIVWPKLPKIEWPELPEIKAPEIALPKIELPEITLPKPPEIQMPNFWQMAVKRTQEPVRRCRSRAIARFEKLPPEQASWQEVDQKFQANHPEQTEALDIENPAHRTYIESWCKIAHSWLDEAEQDEAESESSGESL